jgi:hypothetical protein
LAHIIERDTDRPQRDQRVIKQICGLLGRSLWLAVSAGGHQLRGFFPKFLEPQVSIGE